MSNIACCIFFGFLIILGISDIIEYFITSLFKIENPDNIIITTENLEFILRAIVIKNSTKTGKKIKLNSEQIKQKEMEKMFYVLYNDYPQLDFKSKITKI